MCFICLLQGQRQSHRIVKQMSMYAKPKKCPKCGADSIAEILYGMVSPCDKDLNKKLNAGKIILGGCLVHTDKENPQWYCNNCNHKWGKFEDSNFDDCTNSTPAESPKNQDPPRY